VGSLTPVLGQCPSMQLSFDARTYNIPLFRLLCPVTVLSCFCYVPGAGAPAACRRVPAPPRPPWAQRAAAGVLRFAYTALDYSQTAIIGSVLRSTALYRCCTVSSCTVYPLCMGSCCSLNGVLFCRPYRSNLSTLQYCSLVYVQVSPVPVFVLSYCINVSLHCSVMHHPGPFSCSRCSSGGTRAGSSASWPPPHSPPPLPRPSPSPPPGPSPCLRTSACAPSASSCGATPRCARFQGLRSATRASLRMLASLGSAPSPTVPRMYTQLRRLFLTT